MLLFFFLNSVGGFIPFNGVIATTSTKNIEFVESLGANDVIDYTSTDFSEKVTDVDFVLDSIAGDVLEKSIKTVRKGGVIISIPTGILSHITELAECI